MVARPPSANALDVPRLALPTAESGRERDRVYVERYSEPAVHGVMTVANLSWVQLARITAGACYVEHCARSADSAQVHLALQLRGVSYFDNQRGRTARLVPGDWCLCNSAQRYCVRNPGQAERIALLIPRNRFKSHIDLSAIALRAFPSISGMSKVLHSTLATLMDQVETFEAERATAYAEWIVQIVHFAIDEQIRGPEWSCAGKPLAQRVRAYVAAHLRDPQLSIDTIMQAVGVSRRGVYRAVGKVQDLIWSERLERARRDLLDRTLSHCSISQIAVSWGFRDCSHFSYVFRRRFLQSPREARRPMTTEEE